MLDGYRATADSDEEVPLGGLAKLGSNVADLMTNLESSKLQRPSANMDRVAALLDRNAGQLLTPPSTNAKTSPESPPDGGSEPTASPGDVRVTVSPMRRGGSPLQKGASLAALQDIAGGDKSVTSSTAGLLQTGVAASSSKTDERCCTPLHPRWLLLHPHFPTALAYCFWLLDIMLPSESTIF